MRRKFVFFSDKLEISSEHAMDTNGLLDLKVHQEREEIITLKEEGKVEIWNYYLSNKTEFDIRVLMKRQIIVGGYIFDFSKSEKHPYVVAATNED